jgi:hypothetical protein
MGAFRLVVCSDGSAGRESPELGCLKRREFGGAHRRAQSVASAVLLAAAAGDRGWLLCL